MKKLPIILLAVAICLSLFAGCKPYIEKPAPTEPYIPSPEEIAYNEALNLISDGRLGDARLKLQECLDYQDARTIYLRFVYQPGDEISRQEHHWDDGTVVTDDYRYEYEYDRHGNLILALGYADGTTLAAKYTYEHDEYGRLTRQDCFDGEDVLWKSYVNEFDGYGNLTSKAIIVPGSAFNSFYNDYVYTYNENGLVTEKVHLTGEDKWHSKTEYWTYDDLGNPITYKAVDSAGRELQNSKYVYVYDEFNRVKQVTERNTLGTILEAKTYEYGPEGRIIKETILEKDRTSYTLEYNAFNQVTKKSWYNTTGGLMMTDVKEYDQHGNLISNSRYEANGDLRYTYEYHRDQYGLVTSEIHYSGGEIKYRYDFQYDDVNLYYNPFA